MQTFYGSPTSKYVVLRLPMQTWQLPLAKVVGMEITPLGTMDCPIGIIIEKDFDGASYIYENSTDVEPSDFESYN